MLRYESDSLFDVNCVELFEITGRILQSKNCYILCELFTLFLGILNESEHVSVQTTLVHRDVTGLMNW